jgi:membrane fusion protein (multidrug efflux system)
VTRDPKGNPQTLIVDAEEKVQLRSLTLERAMGDRWLVSSGLAPGDRVIIEGIQKAKPGAPAKIVPLESGSEIKGGGRENTAPPAAKAN